MISDDRMNSLIARAKQAATRISGGGDGTPLREYFNDEVFRVTLEQLIANERQSASKAGDGTPTGV